MLLWLSAAGAAWFLPGAKPNAVFGRLGYSQFWLAVLLTTIALGTTVILLLRPAWRRPAAFRALSVFLSLLIPLAAVECFVALLPMRHPTDNPWYIATCGGVSGSDDLPFERPPHLAWRGSSRGDLAILNGNADPYARDITFQTDMHGFRNSRDILHADLVTIGDSFTEAGNVQEEESFTTITGRLLGLTTRNLGRAGYTAGSELIVLNKYALPCRPKAVVWQLCEANDLDETRAFKKWVARGRPRYFEGVPQATRAQAWQRRSPTWRLFQALRRPSPPHDWGLAGTFRDARGVEHTVRFPEALDVQPPARSHPAWPAFSQDLLAGARLCHSNGVRLLVFMIPMKGRVMGPYTRFDPPVTNSFSTAPDGSLGKLLEGFCAEHQIPFVDATDMLQQHAKAGELVYLPFDTHLSPLGHQVVAELIASHLSTTRNEGVYPRNKVRY